MAGSRTLVTRAAPTEADIVELAQRMRAADAAEVHAYRAEAGVPRGADVLWDEVAASVDCSAEVSAIRFDGELVGIYGVRPVAESIATGRTGVAWLLTTDTVDRYPVTFWRESRRVVQDMLSRWDVLVNAIDARYAAAIRWAARLGFSVAPPAPLGAHSFSRITLRGSL